MHYFFCSLDSESDVVRFQILSVCLSGVSQINHYNYLLTVSMTKQFDLARADLK